MNFDPMPTDSSTERGAVRDILMGMVMSRALQVAVELGIADALATTNKDCEQLATELGADQWALGRLLRALADYGVFQQEADGKYSNSPLSEFLRCDLKSSVYGLGLACGDATLWRAWEHLGWTIRNGRSAFERAHSMSLFEYLTTHPDSSRRFQAAMRSSSTMVDEALAQAYDWSKFKSIIDVGGGTASTLLRLLRASPESAGTLFDRPEVVESASGVIAASSAAPRCKTIGGDFFASVPAGGDAYFLKHILHDWDDNACLRILANCSCAMAKGARLFVCERLIGLVSAPSYARITDLVMLALTQNGRERTEQEYAALLRQSGFELIEAVALEDEFSLLEAARIASPDE